jgi:hypothetical protein
LKLESFIFCFVELKVASISVVPSRGFLAILKYFFNEFVYDIMLFKLSSNSIPLLIISSSVYSPTVLSNIAFLFLIEDISIGTIV